MDRNSPPNEVADMAAANGQIKARDCRCSTVLQIWIRMGPHHFGKLDPHQSERQDPDPHPGDADPQHCCSLRCLIFRSSLLLICGFFRNQPVGEEIAGKSWYYGQISRGDCDTLMAERGQDGDFLVRDSESNVSFRGNILTLCTGIAVAVLGISNFHVDPKQCL